MRRDEPAETAGILVRARGDALILTAPAGWCFPGGLHERAMYSEGDMRDVLAAGVIRCRDRHCVQCPTDGGER